MMRMALIDMPFSVLRAPSLALTQLKAVVDAQLADRVKTDVLYLKHDVAARLGVQRYDKISLCSELGLGEWLYRRAAFPDAPDDVDAFFEYLCDKDPWRCSYAGVDQSLPSPEQMKLQCLGLRQVLERQLHEMVADYRLDGYDLVGFTTTFGQPIPAIAMARRLKQLRPDMVTFVGGAPCEGTMGVALLRNVQVFDFVFSGAALKTFPRWVAALVRGDLDASHGIRGVFSRPRLKAMGPRLSEEYGEELEIDAELPVTYDDFLDSAQRKLEGTVSKLCLCFQTSRGCWWAQRMPCTFCGLNAAHARYTAMRPDKALALLQGLVDRYGRRVRRFQAVDCALPREYPQHVFGHLRPPPGIAFHYELRVDLSGQEIETLVRGGLRSANVGIEALATPSLRLMRKGTTAFQNIAFLKRASRRMQCLWFLLVGSVGEAEATYEKYVRDFPRLWHLFPPLQIFPLWFDRHSTYFRTPETYGLRLEPAPKYALLYPFPAEDIRDLAYHFQDRSHLDTQGQVLRRWWQPLQESIDQWRRRFAGQDGKPAAALYRQPADDGALIVDTRSGDTVVRRLSRADADLLELLEQPLRPETLGQRASGLNVTEWAARVRDFSDAGWLFEENGTCMSLVTPPAGPVDADGSSPAAETPYASVR